MHVKTSYLPLFVRLKLTCPAPPSSHLSLLLLSFPSLCYFVGFLCIVYIHLFFLVSFFYNLRVLLHPLPPSLYPYFFFLFLYHLTLLLSWFTLHSYPISSFRFLFFLQLACPAPPSSSFFLLLLFLPLSLSFISVTLSVYFA